MIKKLLRFRDLQDVGIVNNWTSLAHKIKHHDFPAGRYLSPNVRVWTPEEVAAWVESRPSAATPVNAAKGAAARKVRTDKAAARSAEG